MNNTFILSANSEIEAMYSRVGIYINNAGMIVLTRLNLLRPEQQLTTDLWKGPAFYYNLSNRGMETRDLWHKTWVVNITGLKY